MAATTWSATLTQTTDAEFRAWGLSISTALAAIGLVQTSDTGQINWTTVTKPSGATASQGYEIWRMNDTAQSTAPIFMKIEYGSGNSGANPSIYLTIGTGSNGSGTLNGTPIAARFQIPNSSGVDTARPGFACAQDGFFWLSFAGASAGAQLTFSFGFHRFCDASGVANTDGGFFWYTASMITGAITGITYYRPTATVRTVIFPIPMPSPGGLTSHAYGSDVAIYEPVVWSDRPSRVAGILGCMKGDFAAGTPLSVTAFGSSRTVLPLTSTGGPRAVDYAASTAAGFLAVYS